VGQLSDNGQWWWDGTRWVPARLSPDRRWHWDGSRWHQVQPTAVASGGVATLTTEATDNGLEVGEAPVLAPREIDDPRFGDGDLPAHVAKLPTHATVQLAFVAIGWGWVARRVVRWHVLQIRELQSVAIVPPQHWDEHEMSVSGPGPLPDLAMRDFFGHVLRVEVAQMTSAARKDLLSQVPMSAHVTPAAEMFLEDGMLPGMWGARLKSFGPR
jgi:hypothetical protein